MKGRFQFASMLLILYISGLMASSALAQQHPHAQRMQAHPFAQARQQAREQHQQRQQQKQEQRQERQQQQQQHQQQQQGNQNRAPSNGNNANPNRPPSTNPNRNPNRPPNAVRPRDMTPEQRQKFFQNERKFDQLSPQQKQDMRDRARVWNQMTPAQRDHIRNDVVPKWRQLPPDRQRAIQQRLGVLRNMPESARNEHLDDPNFTRGMNDEDKAMLRDLAHMHVGGAPASPNQ
jgi:Protein of unknown function (DUF3106)